MGELLTKKDLQEMFPIGTEFIPKGLSSTYIVDSKINSFSNGDCYCDTINKFSGKKTARYVYSGGKLAKKISNIIKIW